jgi:threonine/homoserine/homoserine lactone efflux protein
MVRAIFLNPIALFDYSTLLFLSFLIIRRRVKESPGAATASRVALSVFAALLTIAICSTLIAIFLFSLFIRFFHQFHPSMGLAFLMVILGPALSCLLSLAPAFLIASRVSRFFWPPVVPPGNSGTPVVK